MKEKEVKLTMKEYKRYDLITKVLNKELTLKEASNLMEISYRHSKRIKKRVFEQGIIGVKRKSGSGRKGIPDELKQKIVSLYNKKYNDPWHPFNIYHFYEKYILK